MMLKMRQNSCRKRSLLILLMRARRRSKRLHIRHLWVSLRYITHGLSENCDVIFIFDGKAGSAIECPCRRTAPFGCQLLNQRFDGEPHLLTPFPLVFFPLVNCLWVNNKSLIVNCQSKNILLSWNLSSQVCLAAFYTLPRLRNVPALLNDMFPYRKYTIHKHGNSMQKLHKLEQLIFKKTNKNFDTQVENFKL